MVNLCAFEEDCREVSKTAAAILARLADSDGVSSPAFYNSVIRDVASLEQKWERHLRLLSEISLSTEPTALAQFEKDAVGIAGELASRSSAGWARTPELGVRTVRLKVADTLTSLLIFVDRERGGVRAAVQRARNRNVHVPAMQSAVA